MARSFASADSEYLSCAGAPLVGPPYAMACWCKPQLGLTGWPAGYPCAMYLGRSNPGFWSGVFLGIADTLSDEVMFDNMNGGSGADAIALSTASTTTGVWQHIAGTLLAWDEQAAYLNGGNKGTNATGGSVGDHSITRIGSVIGSPLGDKYFFRGEIAEAAIWNLTDWGANSAERAAAWEAVLARLAAGYSPLAFRKGLAGYWPLGGRYGRHDNDVWRGGYHMTAYNTPSWADHPGRIIYPRRRRLWAAVTAGPGPSFNAGRYVQRRRQLSKAS